MNVNLKGAFLSRNEYGRIVNIASLAAKTGDVAGGSGPHYAASKAAIISITKTAARQYAKLGITVNAIAPGFIEGTGITSGMEESARGRAGRLWFPLVDSAVRLMSPTALFF